MQQFYRKVSETKFPFFLLGVIVAVVAIVAIVL